MVERGILFTGEMVRAILEGKKTQTRRIIKNKKVLDSLCNNFSWDGPEDQEVWELAQCPFGKPGDRLWVRETWGVGSRPCPFEGSVDGVEYKADEAYLEEGDDLSLYQKDIPETYGYDYSGLKSGWRPSIHMPRWASRINLEITKVKIERIQEGGDREFWGEEKWKENPWVWVVEFKEVKNEKK